MRGSGVGSAGQAQSLLGATVTPAPEYRTIHLTHGHAAIVDASDYPGLSQYSWCASKGYSGHYATRYNPDGPAFRMHRVIMDAPAGMVVDHINGNTLDNRRCNLRLATIAENSRNQRIHARNSSGIKGVSMSQNKFRAQIWANGTSRNLGRYDTIEEAEQAYKTAAAHLHGDFARFESRPTVEKQIRIKTDTCECGKAIHIGARGYFIHSGTLLRKCFKGNQENAKPTAAKQGATSSANRAEGRQG